MKNIIRLCAALLSASLLPASAAPVFECIQNGERVYTQNPGNNCRKADVGRVGLYSASPAPAAQPQASAQESHSEKTNQTHQAAREQLEQAQKALEDGKKVRYGNERNYVRYQERIQKLEAAVNEAQQNLDRLGKADKSAAGSSR